MNCERLTEHAEDFHQESLEILNTLSKLVGVYKMLVDFSTYFQEFEVSDSVNAEINDLGLSESENTKFLDFISDYF